MNTVVHTANVALVIIAFAAAGCIVTYAAVLFGRFSRHTDEDASRLLREHLLKPYDYQMRYQGGDAPCVVCGEPTPYYLNGRPMHPEHREAAA